MSHPQSWFEERLGKTIKRVRYDVPTKTTHTSYLPILTQEDILYALSIQGDFISFEDNSKEPYGDCKRRARRSAERFNVIRLARS